MLSLDMILKVEDFNSFFLKNIVIPSLFFKLKPAGK
jgi:hypothetical protein